VIIAEQKGLEEIVRNLDGHSAILIAGCKSCVAICHAGGEKEVGLMAESLRLYSDLHGKGWSISETTLERQCEKEWVRETASMVDGKDAVLSLACGVGSQVMQEVFPEVRVIPALNTSNMGAPDQQGIYLEKCGGCGDCTLHLTGGICPVARCSKSMLNGPCGGSQNGRCEVDPEIPCAWEEIYASLKRLGKMELISQPIPPKNWRSSRSGGPRRIVRREILLTDEEKGTAGGRR